MGQGKMGTKVGRWGEEEERGAQHCPNREGSLARNLRLEAKQKKRETSFPSSCLPHWGGPRQAYCLPENGECIF